MSRLLRTFALVALAAVSDPARATDYFWNNTAGGNWNVATNWSPAVLPGAADNATLNALASAYAVTLNDTRNITNLTIGAANATLNMSGTLTASGNVAVNAGTFNFTAGGLALGGTLSTGAGAAFNWSGGTLSGGGTLAGTVAVSGGNKFINSSSLQNSGVLNWTAGTIFTGGASVLTNQATGLIDLKNDGTAFDLSTGGGTITNFGTIRKSAGVGTSTIAWSLDARNGSTIDAATGTINFDGGGTLNNGMVTTSGSGLAALHAGTFTIPNGATFIAAGSGGANLYWTGGILTAGGSAGTLAGTLIAAGGNKFITGTAVQNGGTLAWTAGTIFTGTAAVLTNLPAGTIDLRADGTAFDLSSGGGSIAHQGAILKSAGVGISAVNWAIDLRHGSTLTANAGTINFTGGGTLNTATVTTAGTGVVALHGGTFTIPNGATFTATGSGGADLNWTGGTITAGGSAGTLAGTLIAAGGNKFITGTAVQNGGTLAYTAGTIFTGTAAVLTNLPAGIIDFRNDGTAFDLSSGAGSLVNQGALTKTAGVGSSGVGWAVDLRTGGTLNAASGTLNFNGGGTLSNGTTTTSGSGIVALNNGTFTITGGATFTAAGSGNANLNWTGGTITAGSGGGTLAGTLVAAGGNKFITGTGVANAGTLAWTNGTIFTGTAAVLTNLPAGVIDLKNDGSAFAQSVGSGNIANQGLLKKTIGTGTTALDWSITNSGTVTNNVAGTLNFTAGVTNTGLVTMVNGATIGGPIVSNTGGSVAGPAAGTGTYTGLLTFNDGSTLSPGGGAAGGLIVNSNNVVMSFGSTYQIRLAGSTAITGYSRTTVNGTVALNSATLAADVTGFSPLSTQKYFILNNDGSDAITGTFDGLPNNSVVDFGTYTATISYFGDFTTGNLTGGNDVVLSSFTAAVPEPGLLLGVVALGGLVLRRWRRAV